MHHLLCATPETVRRRLLVADSRNFHAWSYWRWLTGRMQLPAAESLAYTAQKLREDFSNYSAWHARTTLLPAAATLPQVPTLAQMLAEEAGGPTSSSHALPSGCASCCCLCIAVVSCEFELAGVPSGNGWRTVIKAGRDPCHLGSVMCDACLSWWGACLQQAWGVCGGGCSHRDLPAMW